MTPPRPRHLPLPAPGMRVLSRSGRWAVVAPRTASKLAVTDRGTIYSVRHGRRLKPFLRRYRSSRTGELVRMPYRVVSYRDEEGRTRNIEVHRLVAWTFLGDPPLTGSGRPWEVHHRDGNHANNRVSNLVYVEPSNHGSITRAMNGAAPRRMTPEDVDEFIDPIGD